MSAKAQLKAIQALPLSFLTSKPLIIYALQLVI